MHCYRLYSIALNGSNANRRKQFPANVIAFIYAFVLCNISQTHAHAHAHPDCLPAIHFVDTFVYFCICSIMRCCVEITINVHFKQNNKYDFPFIIVCVMSP